MAVKPRIKIFITGKPSHQFSRAAIEEFTDKLKNFAEIEFVILKEKSNLDEKTRLKKEAEEVYSRLPENSFIAVLDERGNNLNSLQFSQLIKLKSEENKVICFVIGSDVGFLADAECDIKISLSSLVLSHEVALTVLLEQIYRSIMIIRGHPYHRA